MENLSLKEFYEGTTKEEFMARMHLVNLCIFLTMDPLTVDEILKRKRLAQ